MKKTVIIIIIGIVLAALIGAFIYFYQQQQKEITELKAGFDEQKETLEEEYLGLVMEYDDLNVTSNNDSLLYLLDAEKAKVQRLLDELKTVKTTNARRINELKKELETVRGVMRSYIIQIDSLNRINLELKQENQAVTEKYNQATQTVSKLSQEKVTLTERVEMAAKLNASNISAIPVNKKGKAEKKVKNVTRIDICFTITKNITTQAGEKTVYARITKPDDDVLIKSAGNIFRYENREIPYSVKKVVEYGGDDTDVCMYWNVEEFLYQGTYRVEIFADGNLIGRRNFSIDK